MKLKVQKYFNDFNRLGLRKCHSGCVPFNSKGCVPFNSKRVKTATVQTQFYPPLQNNLYPRADRPVPWINLRGHWLAQAGFNIGSRYTIEVYKNKLVLTVED